MKLKIFKAVDAFSYLPVYIAQDLGIFETLLKYEVEFITSNGDKEAVSDMLIENSKKDSGVVAVAIADPIAILRPDIQPFVNVKKEKLAQENVLLNDKELDVSRNTKIVGAVINRAAFWAVSRKSRRVVKIEDLKENDSLKLLYPNKEYMTNNYFGEKIGRENSIDRTNLIDNIHFDEVIDKCKEYDKSYDYVIAVTADIANLAKEISGGRLHINYSFPQEAREFLATGILTTKKCCDDNSYIIEKIIEAIQTSVAILYSSEITAERICKNIVISEEFGFKDRFTLTDEEIKEIVKLMKEKIYPPDLNISKESWEEAVNVLSDGLKWKVGGDEERKAKNDFVKYVDNSFVLKSITKRFGIDLNTSRIKCKKDTAEDCNSIKDVKAIKKRIESERDELQEKNMYLEKKHENLKNEIENLKEELDTFKGKYEGKNWLICIYDLIKEHSVPFWIWTVIALITIVMLVFCMDVLKIRDVIGIFGILALVLLGIPAYFYKEYCSKIKEYKQKMDIKGIA